MNVLERIREGKLKSFTIKSRINELLDSAVDGRTPLEGAMRTASVGPSGNSEETSPNERQKDHATEGKTGAWSRGHATSGREVGEHASGGKRRRLGERASVEDDANDGGGNNPKRGRPISHGITAATSGATTSEDSTLR